MTAAAGPAAGPAASPAAAPDPAPRLVIVVNDVPAAGAEVPLRYALVAAALDADVEVHCVGASVAWLRNGAAPAPLQQQLDEAAAEGVRIYACSLALAAHGVPVAELVPAVAGVRGAAALLAAGFSANARFMNF